MNLGWTNPLWHASLFVIYIATSCFGLYFLKAAEGWKTPIFAVGLVLYGAGAVMWMAILRLLPLSFAFPIAAGSLVIGTMLTGAIFLGENMTVWNIIGALMITIGIVLIAANR